jgi:hypothetical protein
MKTRLLFILALLCAFAGSARAQGMPSPNPCIQFFSPSGLPLAGGFLYSYTAGTLTPLPTYTDATLTTPNSNPLILNAGGFPVSPSGSCGLFLNPNLTYKFVLQNSFGSQQWTVDNITTSNVNSIFTQANTWTQLQTFTGGISVPGGSLTFQNLTVTNLNNFQYVGCTNPQLWAGADYGAWINSAIAALPTVGGFASGTIILPACATTVTQSTPVVVHSPYVSIIGAGSGALQISCTVTTDCWNIKTVAFGVNISGSFGGFTLIGQGSANANAVGIHTGDMVGASFSDIEIDNFLGTSSSCFWMDNQSGWFERNKIDRLQTGIHQATQSGCTKNIRATVTGGTNSFARTRFTNSYISVAAATTGISLENNAFWYEGTLEIAGNMVGNGGTVLALSGSANLFNDRIDIGVECSNTCSSATLLSAVGTSTMSWDSGRITGGTGFTNSITTTMPIHMNYGSYDQSQQDRIDTANLGLFNNEGSNFGTWLLSPLGSPAFLGGLTDNLGYNGTNFVTATDLTNNGGGMFVGGHNGQLSLITIPTASPATGQTIPQASIVALTRVLVSDLLVKLKPPLDLTENSTALVCAAGEDLVKGDSTYHGFTGCTNGSPVHKLALTDSGSCTMTTTTCTFSIGASFSTTPLTFPSIDAASAPPATAISAKCSISGTTVTITAGASNTLTWDCLLVGNPN